MRRDRNTFAASSACSFEYSQFISVQEKSAFQTPPPRRELLKSSQGKGKHVLIPSRGCSELAAGGYLGRDEEKKVLAGCD